MTDREPSIASESSQHSLANREAVAPSEIADSVPAGSGFFAVLPTQFGRFRVLKLLGSGAMGSVYLAHDPEDERDIALKIPKDNLARDSALWERFQREARAVGDLNHDNICGMYEVGQIDTTHFIAMQYIVGRPLSDYISADTPPSLRQVASIIRRLARGLAHAHDRGVVHRDLKPANVMIDRRSEPVIMDFGLALRTDSKGDVRTTTSGMIVGSPAYMSPEQVRGDHDKIGPWTDIYGLGVLFFELLTGSLPFSGSMISVLGQIATQPPPKPSSLRADVDPQLEGLCLRMLAKLPEKRPASMVEVVQSLTDWLKRGSSSANDPAVAVAANDEAAPLEPVEPHTEKADGSEAQKQKVNDLIAKHQIGAAIELLEKIVNLRDAQFAPLVVWGRTKLQDVRSSAGAAGRSVIGSRLAWSVAVLLILFVGVIPLVRNYLLSSKPTAEPKPMLEPGTGIPVKIDQSVQSSTMSGGTSKAGRFAGQGAVEIANTAGLLKLNQDFTIEMVTKWKTVRYQSFAADDAWPAMNSTIKVARTCGWTLRFLLRDERPVLDFTVAARPGGEWISVIGAVPKVRPEWSHLAVCRTKDKLVLFLDGDAIAMRSVQDVTLVESPTVTYLGVRAKGPVNHTFDGDISRFAMHQCSRFGNQATRGRFVNDSATLVLIDFDHLENGKLRDQTGLGHDGTILPNVTVVDRMKKASNSSTPLTKTGGSAEALPAKTVLPATGAKVPPDTPGTPPPNPNDSRPKTITSQSTGMTLTLIPAGTFAMGSPATEKYHTPDEGPQHTVRISQPLYLGVYEVKQREYEKVMGTNPSSFLKTGSRGTSVPKDTREFPVETVSWYDAMEFCNKLSVSDGLSVYYALTDRQREQGWIESATVSVAGGTGYRLPTEAEWEYACRAGTTTPFHFGGVLDGSEANVDGSRPYGTTTKGTDLGRTTTVGSYPANAWGLFDMHGNVFEWCEDVYDDQEYANRAGMTTDPLVKEGSEFRVLRGGSWDYHSGGARSADRDRGTPGDRLCNNGFRIVLPAGSVRDGKETGSTTPNNGPVPVPPLVPPPGAVITSEMVKSGGKAAVPKSSAVELSVPFTAAEAITGQAAWAKSLGVTVAEKNSLGMDLVLIPPGKFRMGSPANEKDRRDDEAQVEVTLTEAFWLGKTAVTQGQWEQVMGTRPWSRKKYMKEGSNYAASYVSWQDAQEFTRKLSDLEKATYRLPTEAEWEWSCRAGTSSRWSFGERDKDLGQYAWYGGILSNGNAMSQQYVHPVGQKLANPFGLHDMHGNVREWCEDVKIDDLPGGTNPKVTTGSDIHVLRGGSWGDGSPETRSADRDWSTTEYRTDYRFVNNTDGNRAHTGFRVVRTR